MSVRRLTKRYPVRRAWRDAMRRPFSRPTQTGVAALTFDVQAGEFFGLLGPNGAGKTTLLKVLATYILPDEGDVHIEGHNVVREPLEVRRRVAPVIANERSLYWRLTARENLELFSRLWGLPASEIDSRVREVLEIVGLADTGRKLVGQFSSGMLQRLLIARALLPQPRVLLLDEPTRSLDPVSAREFRRFLREELTARRNCAVVIATHNADEALELCTRVGIMNAGRLLSVGSPRDLLRRIGDDRYVVWTSAPDHPALRRHSVTAASPSGAPERNNGWTAVSVRAAGGDHASATLLADLVRAGVPVARFERADVSLAELIEAVIESAPESET